MLYIINAHDKPDAKHIVSETLEAHRRYLHDSGKVLVLAGGTRTEDGKQRLGSVYLINVDDRKSAMEWLASEPFNSAGLFESITIERMRKGHWHPENIPKTVDGD